MFHVTKVANSYHGGILVTISVKILAQHRVTKMLGEVPAGKVKCKLRSRTLIEQCVTLKLSSTKFLGVQCVTLKLQHAFTCEAEMLILLNIHAIPGCTKKGSQKYLISQCEMDNQQEPLSDTDTTNSTDLELFALDNL